MKSFGAAKITEWREHPDVMVRELFGATPDPWQDEVLQAFPTNQRIAMRASKGPGKELCKETIIPTPHGDRRLGDILVGDLVFAEDGSVTAVTGVYDNGIKPVWRVKFDDGSSVLAGAEHQWKVMGATERRKCLGYIVLNTQQIIDRGVRVKNGKWSGRQFEIPIHGAAQYSTARLPLDPYLFGVWMGDGSRGQPSYFKPYVEVEEEINRRGYKTSRSGDRVRILDCVGDFKHIECFESYGFERFVPDDFKFSDAQQRRDLLCGLMDTDGCIGDDSHMEYDTTSERLARDVVWLVRSVGGNALVKAAVKNGWYLDEDGNKVECRDCYRVTLRTPFNPFRIAHKADRWRNPMRNNSTARYLKRYIDSVEPSGEADCMCISVAHPSQCYLANDFIVTHNTATLAWLGWNYLLTRPHPNIAATSISADNLRDGLWKEMSYWRSKSELLKDQFEITGERIFQKNNPATWFMSARSWSKAANQQDLGNTLAGLHTDYILFLIDESGGMPVAITAAAEAALSSCVEGHIIQAGNTNTLDGALYTACVKQAHLWKTVIISGDPDDPKRSSRVSIEWAREMIKAYGRESSFIKVMVLGEWPEISLNALLGPADVEAAMKRQYQEWDIAAAPRILGVDVASEGMDASVIFPRQGLVAFKPHVMRGVRSPEGAAQVARVWKDWDVNACFVDNTGGFGAGWIDQLRLLRYTPIGVGFAEQAEEKSLYFNRRAEMYFRMAEWIKSGGCLPNDPDLVAELTQTTYTHKGDRLILEPKDMIKAKIGRSPDKADALCLVGGTMISTPSGLTPIEAIKCGDIVETPFGTATVRVKWKSQTTSITSVCFSNGKALQGKGEHKIFAWKKGVVRLDALTHTIAVEPYSVWRRLVWRTLNSYFMKAQNIGFRQAVDIISRERKLTASGFFIGAFGLMLMGKYHRAARFITLMVIGPTVPYQTYNASVLVPTSLLIWRSYLPIRNLRQPTEMFWKRLGRLRLLGTHLQPASNGIVSRPKTDGRTAMRFLPSALNAEKYLNQFSPIARMCGFVLGRALQSRLIAATTQRSVNALTALSCLWQTATAKLRVVPISVGIENVPPTSVYNLTLDRDNAYYANGILVFNCLTFAATVAPRVTAPAIPRKADESYDIFSEFMRA